MPSLPPPPRSSAMSPTGEGPAFPPVRACLFDMDGLLIDSEDAYTLVTNTILRENGRPDLPWSIKAQLQGRPGPAAGKIFHEWAKLPIGLDEFMRRQVELQAQFFPHCKPLPGAETLLARLRRARTDPAAAGAAGTSSRPRRVRLALATSSHTRNFEIKTRHLQPLFAAFDAPHTILGDDPRIPKGRGKPLPDIYLLALQSVNEALAEEGDEPPITPDECLVFEDSVPGVEAGRRAGMRVVWVPHPGLLEVYRDRVDEVLAGLTGEHKEDDLEHTEGIPLPGSPGNVGELRDGWGEKLHTLEEFDFDRYGITYDDQEDDSRSPERERLRSESGQVATPGTTDKELEEMTAMADGKKHAREEPKRDSGSSNSSSGTQ